MEFWRLTSFRWPAFRFPHHSLTAPWWILSWPATGREYLSQRKGSSEDPRPKERPRSQSPLLRWFNCWFISKPRQGRTPYQAFSSTWFARVEQCSFILSMKLNNKFWLNTYYVLNILHLFSYQILIQSYEFPHFIDGAIVIELAPMDSGSWAERGSQIEVWLQTPLLSSLSLL